MTCAFQWGGGGGRAWAWKEVSLSTKGNQRDHYGVGTMEYLDLDGGDMNLKGDKTIIEHNTHIYTLTVSTVEQEL